ncbi:unnamed protein product [Schistosoma mattheei]|uniref:Uncharacterized protein n=1 Tax=Schistosoma mattheei TaxID=31246 RepID=A0A183NKN7_9TREM|nr:unnamed protein product [Schistosoma mattheei]
MFFASCSLRNSTISLTEPVLVSGNVSLVTLSIGLLCVSFVGFSHWFYHASSFSEKNSVGENQKKLNVAEQTLKQLQKRSVTYVNNNNNME